MNEQIKKDLLAYLKAQPYGQFSDLTNAFPQHNYLNVRSTVRDMQKQGSLELDEDKWLQNIILARITPQARSRLYTETPQETYQQRTRMISLGALPSLAFALLLTFNIAYFGGFTGGDSSSQFSANITSSEKQPFDVVTELISIYGENEKNYVIQTQSESEDEVIIALQCTSQNTCAYKSARITLTKTNESWFITKIQQP